MDWVEYYRTADKLRFPSETLVRLLKGPYIEGMPKDLRGLKVLEVGCGSGNNMVMMNQLGMETYGTEIDESLFWSNTIHVGTNTNLGGPDNHFDFLVSWNVLHYEVRESDIIKAIAEYARVLRPGGRLLLSTTGPLHPMRATALPFGGLRHKIALMNDFRCGTVQCFFEQDELREYFGRDFLNVKVGRTMSNLFGHTLDWFIVTAVKP